MSLRWRLLVTTAMALSLTLIAANWWLSQLFENHVQRQFDALLTVQLEQLSARLEVDEKGQPQIDASRLSDPRWSKPYSGLYWQIDKYDQASRLESAVLRSRSLWDQQIPIASDRLEPGSMHWHQTRGPNDEPLRVVERVLTMQGVDGVRWRLMVAANTLEWDQARGEFNRLLTLSLSGLGLGLIVLAWVQSVLGLSPLKTLQAAVNRVRQHQDHRLNGEFPAELQPLVDQFNVVLEKNQNLLKHARTQAGNLAHALKTPLAVMSNVSQSAPTEPWSKLMDEQIKVAERQVKWHLMRSRMAASVDAMAHEGAGTSLMPVLESLIRVLQKVHADRSLNMAWNCDLEQVQLTIDQPDLQQILGNLLDNACSAARSRVWIDIEVQGSDCQMAINDDGPGIPEQDRQQALQRGVRLDEQRPGSGLGLAIALELAQHYGGRLSLDANEWGGLKAILMLPMWAQVKDV